MNDSVAASATATPNFNIHQLLQQEQGANYEHFREHINPKFAQVLKIIGFDRCYVKAQGPYLWDDQGVQYLDFLGGYAVMNCGRNHPVIRNALIDFLQEDYSTLVQFDAPLLAGLLAKQLKQLTPNHLERVYFTNSGTEGVETAIKFAKCATQRPGILFLEHAFHGLSNGSLSLNGDASFRDGFGPFLPHTHRIPHNDLAALEQALAKKDVALFILEPVQGKGVFLPNPGYLEAAAALCRKYGALFAVDEIQSGCGRTGTFFAYEQEGNVDPDMVILSKALSGGYVPIGAVLTRQWIYDKVFSSLQRAVVHSSTFKMGSLAMVAGLASLHVIQHENLAQNARLMGDRLKQGLDAMKPRFEFLKEIRQRGLMLGIELGKPKSFKLQAAWALVKTMDAELFPQAVIMPLFDDHHILTQVAGHHMPVIKLIPPLVITESDVQWFLTAFESVMTALHQFPGPAWEAMKKLGKHAMK